MSEAQTPVARRLLVGAVTNWLAFAATLLVGFFLTPYMVRKLGDGPYGVWAFVESVLAYFTLFDLGIAACVVRFVARFHTTGDRDELNRLVSTCLALFVGLGLLMFATGGSVLPLLLSSLQSAGVPADEVVAFALLMVGNLAITLPLSLFPSILDGLERFALKSAVRIGVLSLRTFGTILLLQQRPSLLMLGILLTACNLLEHALFAGLALRALPGLQLRRRFVDRATLNRVKGYSLSAFLAMIAGRVCVQSGVLIVGAFFGAAPVTYFAIASRLVEFAKALLRSATNTLTPAISSREAAGDVDAIRRMFLRGTRWVLYLILPVQMGLIVFGRPFLTIWLGDPAYAENCYPALVALSSTLALVVAQSIASRVLYGMGRLRVFARMTMVEAAVNVGLGGVLAPRFGLVGVAIGVAIPNLLMCVWVIQYTARALEVPRRQYITEAWFRPAIAATVPLAVWLCADMTPSGWVSLMSAIALGLVPYAMTVFVMEGRRPRFCFGLRPRGVAGSTHAVPRD
ncbi:MAG TPA: polysaccharide biosynthesis C-terminal domain-containing protein [Gemmataceae bacterium]|jgi:O-antigen/teichoic acid export membrane protein|nr:polysaccharide biosynthesis C-terminal domain-containing protein [Gemmataceae bacterium]